MVARGDIHWCDLGEPRGSAPAKRHPVLIIQAYPFNASRLASAIVAVITSNTALAAMPGNVFLPAATSGLPRDSVVNVTAVATVDRSALDPHPIAEVPTALMQQVDSGLRLVLSL